MDKKLNDQTVEEIVEEETETEETTVTEKEERPRRTTQDGATRSSRGGCRPTRGRRTAPKAKEYEERVVYINRVSKTTKGGRRLRFSAVTVVGDGKGKYGFASAKAAEVPDAIKKSLDKAKKDTRMVNIVGDDTIAHEIYGRFGACKVFLKPAPAGTGIIAGGPVRAILELAGIKNVYSKVYGSRTALNVLRATDNGLQGLKSREEVIRLRKTVDTKEEK
jgi:small subunit ribosomal protein S5